MATEELKVRFKVDTSEVKSGADEAKNKVKQTAQSMEGDVKKASSSMSNSLKEISRSTDQIGQSARKATSDLGTMEGQLKNVSRQISAMQMFNMGARGVGMLGGIASNIVKLNGDYESADAIGAGTKVAQGGLQGAAMGFAMGGPMGAAVGSLVGAGNALLEAAVEQKEAARELMKGSVKSIEDIENRYQARREQETIAAKATARDFDVDSARQEIAEARQALEDAKARQAKVQDTLYGRSGGINWMDERQRAELVRRKETALYGDPNNRSIGQRIASWTDPLMDSSLDPEHLVAEQYKLFSDEARNAEAEVQRAQQRLQALAPLQARIDAEQQKATERWMNGNAEFWKAFDDYQSGKAEKEELGNQLKEGQRTLAGYQSQLQGVISRPAQSPTDALTRIGGGRGYTAYNNSTANIQKSIESNLRQLIKNQEAQNQQIIDRLEALRQDPTQATWAS